MYIICCLDVFSLVEIEVLDQTQVSRIRVAVTIMTVTIKQKVQINSQQHLQDSRYTRVIFQDPSFLFAYLHLLIITNLLIRMPRLLPTTIQPGKLDQNMAVLQRLRYVSVCLRVFGYQANFLF